MSLLSSNVQVVLLSFLRLDQALLAQLHRMTLGNLYTPTLKVSRFQWQICWAIQPSSDKATCTFLKKKMLLKRWPLNGYRLRKWGNSVLYYKKVEYIVGKRHSDLIFPSIPVPCKWFECTQNRTKVSRFFYFWELSDQNIKISSLHCKQSSLLCIDHNQKAMESTEKKIFNLLTTFFLTSSKSSKSWKCVVILRFK